MIKTSLLNLQLSDNEFVTCTVAGEGNVFCYIMGPGSFYLKGLSYLAESFTFITCDGLWARNKEQNIDKASIVASTIESLLEKEHRIISKLCEYFSCSKMGIMGFSAPGILILQYALKHSETVAWIIGTGLALCPVDPSFSYSNDEFNARASEEKKEIFKQSYLNYQKLQEGDPSGDPMKTTNFFFDDKKKRMTPNSDYLEQVRFLLSKLIDNSQYNSNPFEHWQNNLHGEVLNQTMREHFFLHIQSELDVCMLLQQLPTTVPALLISGENDFITPPDKKIVASLVDKVTIKLYSNCGHMPYIEQADKYSQDISTFLSSIGIVLKLEKEASSLYLATL